MEREEKVGKVKANELRNRKNGMNKRKKGKGGKKRKR